MATIRTVKVPWTTDASGDVTVYTAPVNGFLHGIYFDSLTADTGTDLTITEEASGQPLATITNTGTSDLQWRPRIGAVPIANTAGGTLAPGGQTTGGEGFAAERFGVIGRIKIVVAQGGNAVGGALVFTITDDPSPHNSAVGAGGL